MMCCSACAVHSDVFCLSEGISNKADFLHEIHRTTELWGIKQRSIEEAVPVL